MEIKCSVHFLKQIKNYKDNDSVNYKKVRKFILQLVNDNYKNKLPGRNKSSIPTSDFANDPDYKSNTQLATENNLWHYHIGIDDYNIGHKRYGDYTSEYIVHYINNIPDNSHLLEINAHPRFRLPSTGSPSFKVVDLPSNIFDE